MASRHGSSGRDATVPPPRVAARQAGVFTAAQAAAEGMSARRVRYLLTRGTWQLVAGRGIVPCSMAPTWTPLQLAWAAYLTWPEGVVGYRIAAALHRLPVEGPPPDRRSRYQAPPPSDGAPQALVHVLLPCRRRPLNGVVSHHVPFEARDVVRFPGGLPVTSMARTVADCLATGDDDSSWALLAWVYSRGLVSRAQLTDQLTRRTNRPGTDRLRTLHARTVHGAVSLAEHRLHALLRGSGIGGWQAGVTIRDEEGIIGVVDVLFTKKKVVVEVDGYGAHSGREAFARDRRRQNRLVRAGYTVLRFTWWDLTQDPDAVIRTVVEVLGEALAGR